MRLSSQKVGFAASSAQFGPSGPANFPKSPFSVHVGFADLTIDLDRRTVGYDAPNFLDLAIGNGDAPFSPIDLPL